MSTKLAFSQLGRSSYGTYTKTKAFLRGIFTVGPLVEIAREGLCGYRLHQKQRIQYARRIASSCTAPQVCRFLEKTTPEANQHIFARILKKHLISELEHFYSLLPSPLENAAPSETLRNFMATRSERLTEIRERACEVLISGNISSEKARHTILSLLLYSNLLDGYCKQEPERQRLINELVDKKIISQEEAAEIAFVSMTAILFPPNHIY
ncbi:hypothetical protein KKB44_04485 [Candidatus Micrarchaeota archaeon]|nr:hypothetical protein [Candidatus Micrarchaeota archaeon]